MRALRQRLDEQLHLFGAQPLRVERLEIVEVAVEAVRLLVESLDGRAQPGKDIKLWEGSSRGRWEGTTLVIEVANQNDSTRFDVVGDFHSDEMKVTERWTFADKDTLQYRATIEDPKIFTRPWTVGVTHKRAPGGTELLEYAGVEGDTGAATAARVS